MLTYDIIFSRADRAIASHNYQGTDVIIFNLL